MALTQPRTIFGIHSFTPYSRTTGLPYGMARVLQNSTFTMEGDLIELKGGSNKYSWAVEDGDVTAELGFSVSEYPNWLFELFGGKAPTAGSAEPSGGATAITDKYGTSVVAATGLLATVTVSTAADLKYGKYMLKATASDALTLYCSSDIDFGRGVDEGFTDDTLAVDTWTGISLGATKAFTDFGFTLTAGGSATVLVVGDTATFEVRPINTYNRSVVIGGIADSLPEFGAYLYAQKNSAGAVLEVNVFKLKASGLVLGAERKTFSNNEYTAKASYDSVLNGICKVEEVE